MNPEILTRLVSTRPSTAVQPRELFLSWNSVPVLAYEGFSRTLLAIKRDAEEALPGLRKENPGSLWPKTTLGALGPGQELSRDDAGVMRDLCDRFREEVSASAPLLISELLRVTFACRSLERRLETFPIPLAPPLAPADDAPPQSHRDQVQATLEEFARDRLDAYMAFLPSRGRDVSYYRADHVETTLIADLGDAPFGFIDRFSDAVDAALPGKYAWFAAPSRHLTVRALVRDDP